MLLGAGDVKKKKVYTLCYLWLDKLSYHSQATVSEGTCLGLDKARVRRLGVCSGDVEDLLLIIE